MSIANIIASGSKMRKTSRKLQFLRNCKFPKDFCSFDPLAIIFAMDIYIFLESVCQGAAGEPIKTPKSWNFFSDPIRASVIFQCSWSNPNLCPRTLIFCIVSHYDHYNGTKNRMGTFSNFWGVWTTLMIQCQRFLQKRSGTEKNNVLIVCIKH